MINLDIFTMKTFNRLRNKAQLFSSLADDHYHTRLMHSLEVNSIALEIIKELKKDDSFKELDEGLASNIALLHDIGHTPYGHIGERTLHKICSGDILLSGLPNFKELGLTCGFKHNINSGLLLKEFLILHGKKVTDYECKIAEGVMKHTAIYYKKQYELDYGFNYVVSGLTQNGTIYNINYSNDSQVDEAIIVAYADEIAQISSDYIDLCTCNTCQEEIDRLGNTLPFVNVYELDIRTKAQKAVECLIQDFVKIYKPRMTKEQINQSLFGEKISSFDEVRKEIIKSNSKIRIHDSIKETYIKELYRYYFNNPKEPLDLLVDFYNRIKAIDVGLNIKEEIDRLGSKVDDIYNYVKLVKERISDSSLSNKTLKDYKSIYKMYIRSVAIYISKMTDSYADHKISKLTKLS